jgi:hypothetical protein
MEDRHILTVADDFESIYDVPFVTVNRVSGEYQAEVILSGDEETDHDRVLTALAVGTEHGVRAYARVFGTYGNVKILFSHCPSAGTIWAGSEWE